MNVADLAAARVTVLDWVEITIFDVTRVIGVVTNQVFQKSALPDAAFATRLLRIAERRSRRGSDFANRVFISRHRVEKSASSDGKVQIACR